MIDRRDDIVDVLHGVAVPDPYRWLEDGSDPEVQAWTTEQNALARRHLDALPNRGRLHRRLRALLSVPTVAAPAVKGERLFTVERGGSDHPGDQAVLVVRSAVSSAAGGAGRVIVDPPALLGDETAALDWYHPSLDGSLVAFGLSVGGDERSTLRLLDVTSGELLDDEIPGTRAASVAWFPDAGSFAYTRYPNDDDYHRQVWTHILGADPVGDELLWAELPDPTAWPDVSISRDGRWLLVHVSVGWNRTDVHLLDRALPSTGAAWTTLIHGVDALTSLQVVDHRLVGTTTLDAPRGRVVSAPLATSLPDGSAPPAPTADRWSTLVAETDAVLDGVAATSRSLLVFSTRSAVSHVDRYPRHDDPAPPAALVALPEPGSVDGWSASPDRDELWFSFSSFTRPEQLFRWAHEQPVAPWSPSADAVDPSRFSVTQGRYPSNDGTSVQLFMVEAAEVGDDTAAAGQGARPKPAILTGYGGFGVSMGPAFSPLAVAHAEAGGLFAVAGIRGGAEEGEAWHRAGQRQHKQQGFDDFTAAADWLVANGHTTVEQLSIRGGSNGGLLVAAVITQRPDLCRAVHCAVPLIDMVRFPQFLIAKLWIPEYGDPGQAEDFGWLHAYSPYHRVVDGTCYPAVLVTTGEEDSRVDPCHARKFAARLQAATACGDDHPILVRVEGQAGHGQGKPIGRQADELTDVASFLWGQLGRR